MPSYAKVAVAFGIAALLGWVEPSDAQEAPLPPSTSRSSLTPR